MSAKTIGTDLTEGSVGARLFRFSVPFMLANLLQTVYNMVDMVVVGHFVGADGLSAVSTCGELIQLYTFIAIGFGGAGQTMIGQFVGAKDRERVSRTIGTVFTVLMLMALGITLFCFATVNWQLGLINLPAEAAESGRAYLLVCAAGMVFIFGYNLISSILRGMGDSKHPLLFIAVASVVNLILDLLFVPVLKLGAMGAALATVLGQGVAFGWALVFLYRRRTDFGFDFKPARFIPPTPTCWVRCCGWASPWPLRARSSAFLCSMSAPCSTTSAWPRRLPTASSSSWPISPASSPPPCAPPPAP